MAVKVEWTPFALAKLREAYDYLNAVASARTARKITDKILSRAEILAQNPNAGQREELLKDYKEEFRYLVQGNYKIVYWLESDKAMISTIFDCRQNPEKMREEVKE